MIKPALDTFKVKVFLVAPVGVTESKMSVVIVFMPIVPLAFVIRSLITITLFLSVSRTVAPEIGAFNVSTTLRSRVNARSTTPAPVPLNCTLVLSKVELIRVEVPV